MANSEKYSRSVLEASDEIKDIYCEPCHKAGNAVIAEGFCVDCSEYLCGPCNKIHRRYKALANHVLLDKDSMPIAKDFSVDISEKCQLHPNKVIDRFCETCDKLVCDICVATDHSECEEVVQISDIARDLVLTEEFQQFKKDIKLTANALSEHEKMLKANVSTNKKMEKLANLELNHQRVKVNSFFDLLEKQMNDQITTLKKRNRRNLKAASKRLENMKTDFEQTKNNIETKTEWESCELFIAMKLGQEKMRQLDGQFGKMQEELKIQPFTVLPSEQIQTMIRTTTGICRIATANPESDIDIVTSDNFFSPRTSGLTIIHGHYCVALDNSNERIKVVDTKSKCVISEIITKEYVLCSVTTVGENEVAVAVSSITKNERQIQFFTVSASGIIQKTNRLYDVEIEFTGMVYCAGNIYGIAVHWIDKIDMQGNKQAIYTDLTANMERIAISPDGQTLYVTDWVKHSVTSMTLDGNLKAVYENKDLKNPRGITVDKHGYVYVCSVDTNNVQQLTADLHMVQVLIEDVHGGNIAYSKTDHTLFISAEDLIQSDTNIIYQYSLDF